MPAQTPTSTDLASDDPALLRARLEVEKMRILVENGTVDRSRLDKAELDLLDKQDEARITRALYGRDVTAEQAMETIQAAEHRRERRKKEFDELTQKLEAGQVSSVELMESKNQLDRAEKDVNWAIARQKLVKQVELQNAKKAAIEAERRAKEEATANALEARLAARAKAERERRRVLCGQIFKETAGKKVVDLTVIESRQIRACDSLGLYTGR